MKLMVAIIGPTASGKTTFAIEIAKRVGGEVIGMDSTTVYRGLDIGSSKPTPEERAAVPHHLIDVISPSDTFSAGRFVELAEVAIKDIQSRGKVPILVGGTYFYLKALQHGMYPVPEIPTEVTESIEREYFDGEEFKTARMHADLSERDPVAATQIHPNDRYRLVRALAIIKTTGQRPSDLKPVRPTNDSSNVPGGGASGNERYWLKYAIGLSRHTLNQAISNRTDQMIKKGLLDETRSLYEQFPEARCLQSIGYAEAVACLQRRLTEKQLRNEIIEKTRQLAKRQITWLKGDPEVRYIDFRDLDRAELEIKNLLYAFGDLSPQGSERGAACIQ